jgi:hypothetical protein
MPRTAAVVMGLCCTATEQTKAQKRFISKIEYGRGGEISNQKYLRQTIPHELTSVYCFLINVSGSRILLECSVVWSVYGSTFQRNTFTFRPPAALWFLVLLIFGHEDAGNTFLRNVDSYKGYKALHPRDGNFRNYRCESLKFYNKISIFNNSN